jgi:hypothetical protein
MLVEGLWKGIMVTSCLLMANTQITSRQRKNVGKAPWTIQKEQKNINSRAKHRAAPGRSSASRKSSHRDSVE